MPDIDFGLAYHFIDPADGVPRQLRFHHDCLPGDPIVGQLVAVVAQGRRPGNGHIQALSRGGVPLDSVEQALDGWQTWAAVAGRNLINLAAIRRRIVAAGLA